MCQGTLCLPKKMRGVTAMCSVCRLWDFLGSPSQRSKAEQATNGVFCRLSVIFFKCSKQALVSSFVDGTELFPR